MPQAVAPHQQLLTSLFSDLEPASGRGDGNIEVMVR